MPRRGHKSLTCTLVRKQPHQDALQPFDDEGKRRPVGIAAQQIGQCRTDATGEATGAVAKEESDGKDDRIAQIDVPLCGRHWHPDGQGRYGCKGDREGVQRECSGGLLVS